MGLMMLFDLEDFVLMWLLLVVSMALTLWEAREQDFDRRATAWWVLLVALTHVAGYLALRVWSATRGTT